MDWTTALAEALNAALTEAGDDQDAQRAALQQIADRLPAQLRQHVHDAGFATNYAQLQTAQRTLATERQAWQQERQQLQDQLQAAGSRGDEAEVQRLRQTIQQMTDERQALETAAEQRVQSILRQGFLRTVEGHLARGLVDPNLASAYVAQINPQRIRVERQDQEGQDPTYAIQLLQADVTRPVSLSSGESAEAVLAREVLSRVPEPLRSSGVRPGSGIGSERGGPSGNTTVADHQKRFDEAREKAPNPIAASKGARPAPVNGAP